MRRAKVRIERALRRARRADEDRVLARDRGDEQQADDLVLAQEALLERARELGEPLRERRLVDVLHLLRRDRHRRGG